MPLTPGKSEKGRQPSPVRLETQIHRRKKARALSPLESEWERTDEGIPSHLRMNADLMAPKISPVPKK
jgi:hypothetical protein